MTFYQIKIDGEAFDEVEIKVRLSQIGLRNFLHQWCKDKNISTRGVSIHATYNGNTGNNQGTGISET